MTQGIRKLEEQEEQAEQLADKDPAEEPARKKTTNTRRSAKAGAAEKHSLGLHGEQMLLAFVRGNRRFRAHRRRLDQHALYAENLHQAAAVYHPGVQKDFKR